MGDGSWFLKEKKSAQLFRLLMLFALLNIGCISAAQKEKYVQINGVIVIDVVHYPDTLFDLWPVKCDISDDDLRNLSIFIKTPDVFKVFKPIRYKIRGNNKRIDDILKNNYYIYIIGKGIVKEKEIELHEVKYIEPIGNEYFYSDHFMLSKNFCKN